MWRIRQLGFDIKRLTWFRFLCLIHGHDIDYIDDPYITREEICYRCFKKEPKYEHGGVYWLNQLYGRYVHWSTKNNYDEFLWPREERFQEWFNAHFPNGRLKNWIYRWWEY